MMMLMYLPPNVDLCCHQFYTWSHFRFGTVDQRASGFTMANPQIVKFFNYNESKTGFILYVTWFVSNLYVLIKDYTPNAVVE